MRSSAPALLPIFRSDVQGRLLAVLSAHPEAEWSLSVLARRLGAHVATIQRETARLEDAGMVRSRRDGRNRLVHWNPDNPYSEEVGALVLKVFGPVGLLSRALSGIKGVDEAYVFGSWAERFDGVRGPAPGDIDVLVVGRPDPDRIDVAMQRVEKETGFEVNAVIRSTAAWAQGKDGFLRTVRRGALVPVDLRR